MSTLTAASTTTRPTALRGRVRGRILLLLSVFYAIAYVDRVNISTAAPFIRADLGLSDAQLGLVLSAFALPYALLQVLGGWLGDKVGARRTLGGLSVVWALATIATGGAMGLTSLFAARLLLGLGEAAAFPTSTNAMSRWLPSQLRGVGQGVVHAASRLANALAPLLVGGLIAVSSWRVSFVLLGVLSLGWAAVWLAYYKDRPREHAAVSALELRELSEGAAATREGGRTPWRTFVPALLPVSFVDFCYGWLLWVYLTWLPTVLQDSFGLALSGFALYTTLILLAGVAGDLVGGRFSDRLLLRSGSLIRARRLPLIVGLGGSLLCLLPAVFGVGLVGTGVSLAAAFFCLELTNSTLWALPMDVAPDHAGAASGLMNTGYGLAGILSPSVFGVLLQHTGDWRVPLLLSLGLLGLGVLVACRIDPRRRTGSGEGTTVPAAPAAA
jgi:MFS family permease